MAILGFLCIRLTYIVLAFVITATAHASAPDGVVSCLLRSAVTNFTVFQSRHSSSSQYYSILNFSVQNLRFAEPTVRKPYVIILPRKREEVQKSVRCSRQGGWDIRVRSGGHSYEGLSYTSDAPFVMIDLMNLKDITIDLDSETAWVEAGATLGELYSAVAQKSNNSHAFPAGVCPTIGVGGHFSGGGLSFLSRKYGLSSDNVIDAVIVDGDGRLLDRKGMGEDVFWALRGGGGGSWGAVVAWKIRIVKVPPLLTLFMVYKTGRQNVTESVHRFHSVAPFMEEDLFMRVMITGIQLEKKGKKDVRASFHGIYLGSRDKLLRSVKESFPELGMRPQDCNETTWIESIAYFAGTTVSDLPNRYLSDKVYFKIKSDFLRRPVPPLALEGAWRILKEELTSYILFSPLGGAMDRIPSDEIPFPHRAGSLFDVQYYVEWNESRQDAHYIAWMRKLYSYMTPYVSTSPRAAYVNYLDLDLGSAWNGTATVEEARAWGEKYFLHNFDRLVKVKTQFDPHNIFRNSQSIPVSVSFPLFTIDQCVSHGACINHEHIL